MAKDLETRARTAVLTIEKELREIGNLLRDLNAVVTHVLRHKGKYYTLPAGEDEYKA